MQKKINNMFSSGVKIVPVIDTTESLYTMNFDGCCKGNPGKGGAGAVIYKDGLEIWGDSVFVGKHVTNNISEYTGLIIGMDKAVKLKIKNLHVKGDSLLIIKQMQGEYKITSENLIPLYKNVKSLEKSFDKVIYEHVYREYNVRADALSNEGLTK